MPNWVQNWVQIEGSTEDLKKVKEQLKKPYKTFHKDWNPKTKKYDIVREEVSEGLFQLWNIISPEESQYERYFTVSNSDTLDDKDNWYQWNWNHWSTKWDVNCESFEEDEDMLSYSFDTAWSPPENALIELSKQYPNLIIRLDFGGEIEEEGTIVFKNGESIEESIRV